MLTAQRSSKRSRHFNNGFNHNKPFGVQCDGVNLFGKLSSDNDGENDNVPDANGRSGDIGHWIFLRPTTRTTSVVCPIYESWYRRLLRSAKTNSIHQLRPSSKSIAFKSGHRFAELVSSVQNWHPIDSSWIYCTIGTGITKPTSRTLLRSNTWNLEAFRRRRGP